MRWPLAAFYRKKHPYRYPIDGVGKQDILYMKIEIGLIAAMSISFHFMLTSTLLFCSISSIYIEMDIVKEKARTHPPTRAHTYTSIPLTYMSKGKRLNTITNTNSFHRILFNMRIVVCYGCDFFILPLCICTRT